MSEGSGGQRGVDKCFTGEVRPELTRRRILVACSRREEGTEVSEHQSRAHVHSLQRVQKHGTKAGNREMKVQLAGQGLCPAPQRGNGSNSRTRE